MQAKELSETSGPALAGSVQDLTDRFVALLDLPGADSEVQEIAGMLHAALGSAQETGQAELLDDALRFAQGRLTVRGLSRATCAELGAALETAAAASLAARDLAGLHDLISRCIPGSSTITPPGPAALAPLSAEYVEHLLQGDRKGAIALTRRCVTDGMDIYEVLLDILEPAQQEVGRRWALGLISVAQELFCTAVTQFVMTDLYPGLFNSVESHRRLVAVHVPGSLHHVGLRMVVDVLECRDWSTTYIVEDITVEALPDVVATEQADLLLISAAMPAHVSQVGAMVRAIRADPRTSGVKIVVGGRPFNVAPELVHVVGADGWAADARSAVEVCDAFVGGPR